MEALDSYIRRFSIQDEKLWKVRRVNTQYI